MAMTISSLTGLNNLIFNWQVLTDVLSTSTIFEIHNFSRVSKLKKRSKYCHNIPTQIVPYFMYKGIWKAYIPLTWNTLEKGTYYEFSMLLE